MNNSRPAPKASRLVLNDWEMFHAEAGEGQAIVFIHGGFPNLLAELRRADNNVMEWNWEYDFCREFRFIWYDRRGCYRSSTPEHGYDLETQAADLVQLLDALELDAAHIIGSSAGGPIAIVASALYPSRIRSLTLVGTGMNLFPQDDPATQVIKQYAQSVQTEGRSALLNARPAEAVASFDGLWEPDEFEARGELAAYLTRQDAINRAALATSPMARQRYYGIELQAVQAYITTDLNEYTPQVTCPSFVLHGTRDKMVPMAWAQELSASLSGSQFEVIEDGPHGLVFRSPAARQAILNFLLRV